MTARCFVPEVEDFLQELPKWLVSEIVPSLSRECRSEICTPFFFFAEVGVGMKGWRQNSFSVPYM